MPQLNGSAGGWIQPSIATIESCRPVHCGEGNAVSGGQAAHIGNGVLSEGLGVFLAVQQPLDCRDLTGGGPLGQITAHFLGLGCPSQQRQVGR